VLKSAVLSPLQEPDASIDDDDEDIMADCAVDEPVDDTPSLRYC